MKSVTLVTALAVALAPTATAAPPSGVVNIGHRGASGLAPEHTIASYDLALRLGATYIEQDLQMTRDGVPVALHDSTLDRTARGPAENCTGPVATKTLAQLKTCDVGSWFNEAYPDYAKRPYAGLKIPTLEEVFSRYGTGVNYYIEVKDPELNPGIEEELLRLLDEYNLTKRAESDWQVLIQSFDPTSLQKIHALNPKLPLIQLNFGTSESIRPTLDYVATYAVGIGPSYGGVDEGLVDAAHERCLKVHPYTVNGRADMRALLELGVDGMFTNFPNRLRKEVGTTTSERTKTCAAI